MPNNHLCGEIVHFRIDEQVIRPMLILRTNEDSTVDGILFLNLAFDKTTKWVQENVFFAADFTRHQFPVNNVLLGNAIGQYILPKKFEVK